MHGKILVTFAVENYPQRVDGVYFQETIFH